MGYFQDDELSSMRYNNHNSNNHQVKDEKVVMESIAGVKESILRMQEYIDRVKSAEDAVKISNDRMKHSIDWIKNSMNVVDNNFEFNNSKNGFMNNISRVEKDIENVNDTNLCTCDNSSNSIEEDKNDIYELNNDIKCICDLNCDFKSMENDLMNVVVDSKDLIPDNVGSNSNRINDSHTKDLHDLKTFDESTSVSIKIPEKETQKMTEGAKHTINKRVSFDSSTLPLYKANKRLKSQTNYSESKNNIENNNTFFGSTNRLPKKNKTKSDFKPKPISQRISFKLDDYIDAYYSDDNQKLINDCNKTNVHDINDPVYVDPTQKEQDSSFNNDKRDYNGYVVDGGSNNSVESSDVSSLDIACACCTCDIDDADQVNKLLKVQPVKTF